MKKSPYVQKTINSLSRFIPKLKTKKSVSILSTPLLDETQIAERLEQISIHTINLDTFIKCLCDGNIAALDPDQIVPPDRLESKWLSIYEDYVDAVCGLADKKRFAQLGRISVLRFKIVKFTAIHQYLEVQDQLGRPYDTDIIDTLRYMGVYIREQLSLPRLEGQIKKMKIELEVLERKLIEKDELSKTNSKIEKTTRDTFQDFIAQLEEHRKIPIREEELTVARFISIIKQYHRHIEHMEEQMRKMKERK